VPELSGVLALIPARGGSKSIPRKNALSLAGAPLLAWSVAAARESRLVSRTLVSTDDPEIRELALAWGAEAPFLRPAELARDDTPDLPVFRHALEWLAAEEGFLPGVVIQLRPTSPLRPPGLVDAALRVLLSNPDADSLRTVCPPAQTPYKMWRVERGFLVPLLQDGGPEPYNQPRQRLSGTLWQTGHVDVIPRATLLSKHSMTGARIAPFLVDPAYAIDIDTEEQWRMAEQLVERQQLELVRPELRSAVD